MLCALALRDTEKKRDNNKLKALSGAIFKNDTLRNASAMRSLGLADDDDLRRAARKTKSLCHHQHLFPLARFARGNLWRSSALNLNRELFSKEMRLSRQRDF